MSSGPDLTVLLLGSGGREHALAWKLAQSPRLKNLYALPGSDALSQWAQTIPGDPCDAEAVIAAASAAHAKLVVVGPEAPLAAGVADALRAEGVAVFGPGRAAARLESSKAFAKQFLRRHGVPTADYEAFSDAARARDAVRRAELPVVVKADGLASGKGVRVCQTREEALEAVADFMERDVLGDAGRTVVLESCLTGPEASVMLLCDGRDYRLLPAGRDHKRLKDNDLGPNTGGMGVLAPAPIDPGAMTLIRARVLDPVIAGLREDGLDFRGLLYVGLMLSPQGPQVLEFNVRFGDPETQAVLPLLRSDLLDLCWACAQGDLRGRFVEQAPGACVSVTLASAGYPGKPETGRAISGLDAASQDALVFHAGTRLEAGRWVSAGGRVLSVTAVGANLGQARDKAYAAASRIHFEGMQLRRDIASREPALR